MEAKHKQPRSSHLLQFKPILYNSHSPNLYHILYIIHALSFICTSQFSQTFAEETSRTRNISHPDTNEINMSSCNDCYLVSHSIDDIIRKPRQMDSAGQMEEKIDLEKIKKGVCKDVVDDVMRERCRSFYFTQQKAIQKWKQSNTRSSFHDFVCIRELKFCCPRNSFGPKCNKCPTCNTNERCHGEGTRAGSGNCVCKEGHSGPKCNSCLPGYYSDYLNSLETKVKDAPTKQRVICKRCHKSCDSCRQAGPLGCEVCKKGFSWYPSYGCADVDECIKDPNICGPNTFCVNTLGSYFCYECDRACDGCHGDGPDMCLRCAKGYKMENGNCLALAKTILPPEANYYSKCNRTWCRFLHRNLRICHEQPFQGCVKECI